MKSAEIIFVTGYPDQITIKIDLLRNRNVKKTA
jgi:hypothetical protein